MNTNWSGPVDVMVKKNNDIREAAKAAGVKLWMIATKLHIQDNELSRMMRVELDDDYKARIFQIIKEIK